MSTDPFRPPSSPLTVRPKVREAEDLASDNKINLQEKYRRIEELAAQEEAEGFPPDPVLVWRETAAMNDEVEKKRGTKLKSTDAPEVPK